MKTLKLTLKNKWFNLVNTGKKTEEYREIKAHWIKRFISLNFTRKDYLNGGAAELILQNPQYFAEERTKHFDRIEFKNGYAKNSPTIICEFNGFEIRTGDPAFGANEKEIYFVLKIGSIIERKNGNIEQQMPQKKTHTTLFLFEPKVIMASAVISECGKYRYSLERAWDETKPKVMFIMLNPSTADENNNDPTIRRCINFAKSWGFGGLYVCNLFAFRATNPKELLNVDNPFGDQNIWYTKGLSEKVDTIICAWGNEPILKKILKNENPFKLLDYAWHKLFYLQLGKNATPKHPLYLRHDITPERVPPFFL